jgi:hypothetical protein
MPIGAAKELLDPIHYHSNGLKDTALSMQVSMFSHCQVGLVHSPLLFSTSIPLIWDNCLFIVDGGKVTLIIQGSHWMECSEHKEVTVMVVKAET